MLNIDVFAGAFWGLLAFGTFCGLLALLVGIRLFKKGVFWATVFAVVVTELKILDAVFVTAFTVPVAAFVIAFIVPLAAFVIAFTVPLAAFVAAATVPAAAFVTALTTAPEDSGSDISLP
jgi:hypothetical protein